jgi:L-lactate utilization protein LutB
MKTRFDEGTLACIELLKERWGMISELAEKLTKNGFEVVIVPNAEAVGRSVLDMIPHGVDIGLGGSVTLRDLKLDAMLRERGHEVHDHWLPGRDPEEMRRVLRKQISSPVFLTSVNAVTADGKLVNIDNTGNRVAAMSFGPEHVVAVVGKNKIVADVHAAVSRVRSYAGPANAKRKDHKTPCVTDGKCHDCDSPDRLCRVVSILEKKTRGVGRFTVILVEEDLGY